MQFLMGSAELRVIGKMKQHLYKIDFFDNKDEGKSSRGESMYPPIFWANDTKISLFSLQKNITACEDVKEA